MAPNSKFASSQVLMLVMMTGLVSSLKETRTAYYERNRLADVFAPVKRAPDRLAGRLATEGIRVVEPSVTGSALIGLPDVDLPVQAQPLWRGLQCHRLRWENNRLGDLINVTFNRICRLRAPSVLSRI